MERVGFIGLGAMGDPMARNVLKRGYPLVVHDVRREAMEALEGAGAHAAKSPQAVAESSDVIITMLPGASEVTSVYLGQGGIAKGARAGQVAIDMSTVPPMTSRQLGAELAKLGVRMLDAPVARTREAAVAGTLSIMVGGDRETFEQRRHILEAMGSDVSYCGALGAGEVVKLVNNLLLFANITALAEGLVLGVKAGVEATTLVDVLSKGSSDSFALRNHVAKSVFRGDFSEGRFSVDYALKDLRYAMEMAESLSVPMLQLAVTRQLYALAKAQGRSKNYYPVVFTVVEQAAGVQVRGVPGTGA
jgi:3-hydroxyisobutyrate dehydrogenase-like beta-hydroxyacid dehydrogenase